MLLSSLKSKNICYFLGGITRYKHLIVILMTITTIVYLCKNPRHYIPIFKTFVFASVSFLVIATFVSLVFTPELKANPEINNSVVENVLLCTSIAIPVLLREESKETISKLIFFSFLATLSLRCLSELVLYYQDYQQGIMPFTNYQHRGISDAMVFLFPVLLNLWLVKSAKYRILFLLLGAIYTFLILGTLSRGAWLSAYSLLLLHG